MARSTAGLRAVYITTGNAPVTEEALGIERPVLDAAGIELVVRHAPTEAALADAVRDTDAVLAGATVQVTEPVLAAGAAGRLRVVSKFGVGVDNIDLEAATRHGIIICNVPDYCMDEVSDHAMALILAWARRVLQFNEMVQQGGWRQDFSQYLMEIHPLRGQTLGVIGIGRIGGTLVPKAQAFGLRVIAHDPYATPARVQQLGVARVSLDELLAQSDFITIHTPLTAETRRMISTAQFAKMKPNCFLVNTARGPVVDNAALAVALDAGQLAGAGLDVTDPEPPGADFPLRGRANVILTPHYAFFSLASAAESRRRTAENAVLTLRGEMPNAVANPDILAKVALAPRV